jgi:hypothetical protein
LTLTLGRCTSAPRRAWQQDPPARRPPGGVYRAGGKGGRRGGSAALPGSPPTCLRRGQCRCNRCRRRCQAFASHRRSQRRCRGRPWTSILPTSCCCAAAAEAAAAAAAGVSVCVGVPRCCRQHCHGGNLAVIIAASAAIAAAVGGGRTPSTNLSTTLLMTLPHKQSYQPSY